MTSRFESRVRLEPNGFALVITLIMVVLAAIIVVALMSSASLERGTAKSVDDRYQAEIAAQNALEAAKKALIGSPTAANPVVGDDTFLVLRADGNQTNSSGNKDAYYFLAKAQSGAANKIDCYPLFAGGAASQITINLSANPAVQKPQAPIVAFSNPAQETFGSTTKIYPQLLPFEQPAFTQWQEIRDPNDSTIAPAHSLPYQRYTFWVEDLAGYIDASVAGNTAGTGGGNARPLDQSTAAKRYQTSSGEIAMFTLFNSVPNADPGNTAAKSLISNRQLLFTVPTLKQLAPGAGNTDVTTPYLGARLTPDSELPLVPYGYGYKDEGDITKPRLDINARVTTGGNAAVQAIATKINDNLPTFGPQRQGGLIGQDYVKTLAASMIDYADIDSDATTGVDYRGYDSYPLVNEIYSRKWWTKTYLNSSTNTYFVTVEMDTWAELWNPSNQVVSGTFSLDMSETLPIQTGVYSYTFGIKPSDLPNNSTVVTTYPSAPAITVTLQPDDYVVYDVRHDVFEFNSGIPPGGPLAPPAGSVGMPLTGSSATNYDLKWVTAPGTSPSILVDHAGGGIARIGGNLKGYGASDRRWSGGDPGFGYVDATSPNSTSAKYDTMGDPRSAFYIQGAQVAIAYDVGSSFWERNNRNSIAGNPIYKEVKPSNWTDGGHDSAISNYAPGNVNKDPPTANPNSGAPASEATKAPATISNAGSYSTVAELSNIFDPGLWNFTVVSNAWTDITSTSQSSSNYGGGMTLRLGRPEFTLFDKPGTRASQLLDLFQAGNRVSTRGLVNLNTASRDALRALGAGALLNRDPDIKPTSLKDKLYPPYDTTQPTPKQADKFADAVLAARPFLSPAQLASIKVAGGTSPFFGKETSWDATSQPTEWNDSGREEYFAKIFPLTAVHSRNFRVFVTGQALDKNGNVLSTVSKVFQVYLNPTRDAAGKITSQNTVITYEALLPL